MSPCAARLLRTLYAIHLGNESALRQETNAERFGFVSPSVRRPVRYSAAWTGSFAALLCQNYVVFTAIRFFLHDLPRAQPHLHCDRACALGGTAPATSFPAARSAALPRRLTTQCTIEPRQYSSLRPLADPGPRSSLASGSP